MKTISFCALATLAGGLANPVFTSTLYDPTGTGAMQYSNHGLDCYVFLDKAGSSSGNQYVPFMRTSLCFRSTAEVEITRSPSSPMGYVITIEASEYPVKGSFDNSDPYSDF